MSTVSEVLERTRLMHASSILPAQSNVVSLLPTVKSAIGGPRPARSDEVVDDGTGVSLGTLYVEKILALLTVWLADLTVTC